MSEQEPNRKARVCEVSWAPHLPLTMVTYNPRRIRGSGTLSRFAKRVQKDIRKQETTLIVINSNSTLLLALGAFCVGI